MLQNNTCRGGQYACLVLSCHDLDSWELCSRVLTRAVARTREERLENALCTAQTHKDASAAGASSGQSHREYSSAMSRLSVHTPASSSVCLKTSALCSKEAL